MKRNVFQKSLFIFKQQHGKKLFILESATDRYSKANSPNTSTSYDHRNSLGIGPRSRKTHPTSLQGIIYLIKSVSGFTNMSFELNIYLFLFLFRKSDTVNPLGSERSLNAF